nr:immunoglobulin light chain junction region [Macaca mulatta]MOW73681.1 immunoglobulin light chain junction region [Macaca mulatta]
CQHTYGTPFTF